ncbi:hypothetical protein [Streptomyces sp. cg36]|uniref:hypothetical protein n=1 Tax=Streptomyces sp. cg36 TaxID=3238798 RepID=UPI0034E2D093
MSHKILRLTVPLALLGVVGPAATAMAADQGEQPPALAVTQGPADKTSVTVVRPGADGKVTPVSTGQLRLKNLDASGRGVLTPGPSLRSGASGAQQLRPGDVIAAPAAPGTPHGALVKVNEVHTGADGSVDVRTVPADLTELLGDARADLNVPLTRDDIKVRPLGAGTTVRTGPQQTGSGNGLHFDVDVPLPSAITPTQGHSAPLSAGVDFAPELKFSYERAHWYGVAPSKALIGLAGDYTYGVKVHAQTGGAYESGHKPLHIPAAEVNVDKTVWLGPVPIVLNLKVDYFYEVSADGKVSLDAEQHTQGRLEVGARYDKSEGWRALTSPRPTSTATPPQVSGSATAKSGIGAHTEMGLYGSVGVAADTEPYLKAKAATQDSRTQWSLDAGLDVTGSFFAKLKLFGTPVVDQKWPLPPLNWQWKVAGSDT